MQCPKCQADVPAGMKFCGHCATPITLACVACGFANPPDFSFCGSCATALQDNAPGQDAAPINQAAEQSERDAERRHVTVMFCDIVGSTLMSQQLDPEDLRTVIRGYQDICSEAAELYKGHIAQYLGDGVMIYFGYPRAQENDAVHAVLSGLAILEKIARYNERADNSVGVRLRLRIGVHTGLVVAGTMGAGDSSERLAVGDVPNIASGLESIADPDSIVVSERTVELIRGYFNLKSLGERKVHGIAKPMPVFQVLSESGARDRLEALSQAAALTPIVGRDLELALLADRWKLAKDGKGQTVVISGEAGIGKTRLIERFKESIRGDDCVYQEYRCSVFRENSVLYPAIDFMQRWLGFSDTDPPEVRSVKLESGLSGFDIALNEALPLLAKLLGLPIPEGFSTPVLSPQRMRDRTLEVLREIVWELAAKQPVLLVVDDLQWVDTTTLELLETIIDHCQGMPILVVVITRPEYLRGWVTQSHAAVVTLTGMTNDESEQLIRQVCDGRSLPSTLVNELLERTDGIPLYIEELTKLLTESDSLENYSEFAVTAGAARRDIPHTLQHALMARLDQQQSAKRVAQLGSAIGRHFTYALIREVAQLDDEELQRELRRLEKAELIYRRGVIPTARFVFKHALIQDAAYQSLLRSQRQQIHRRIAEVFAREYPEASELEPETFAHHYTEAGDLASAIAYWLSAGKLATNRSANTDAINHLGRGLDLLSQLPDNEDRDRLELDLQATLGPVYIATRGFSSSEVESNYARAKELSIKLEDTNTLFGITQGQLWHHLLSARYETALAMCERLTDLAAVLHEPEYELETNRALGMSRIYVGEFVDARRYLERVVDMYDPKVHAAHADRYASEPGVIGLSYLARTEWFLGFPDRALEHCEQAIHITATCTHNLTNSQAMCMMAIIHLVRGETAEMEQWCARAMDFAAQHSIPYFRSLASILKASVSTDNNGSRGTEHVRLCLSAYKEIGAMLGMTQFLAILAQMHIQNEDYGDVLSVVDEALEFVADTSETYYEAELYRLRGAALTALADDDGAQAAFQSALEVARAQSARSWELMAATSLARLWCDQGKEQAAHDLLAPVFNWFTEGFTTEPLVQAKLTLDQLSSRL